MPKYISLLRGINVGGHRKIKMAVLRSRYESLGFSNVQSLLQSGNVVFSTDDEAEADELCHKIEAEIEGHFGYDVQVFIRTPDELNTIITNCPFTPEQLEAPKKVAVMFLDKSADQSAQEALLTAYQGVEEIVFSGREVYLFYVNGMGRSRLTNAYIEGKLKINGTTRNWNTVNKLLAL